MLKKVLLGLGIMSLGFSSAFALEKTTHGTTTEKHTETKIEKTHDKLDPKDAESLSWLIIIDNQEIAAANEAHKKKVTGDVKEFADWMIKEHKANLKETQDLNKKLNVKPVKTDEITKLEEEGKKTLKKLEETKDKFEKEYMDTMVKGHQDVLDKLKAKIDDSKNEDVKSHLTNTQTHVQSHLDKAKSINDKLSSQ